ncbi:hypothetical protein QEG73_03555 [Chitinophagaceae bacterium 26-R-25]|nr:hypothetical protein [Chitinophagaceae bacterium 26-R-25]
MMKRKNDKTSINTFLKQAYKVKVCTDAPSTQTPDFIKKKMEKGAKILASCPLPK